MLFTSIDAAHVLGITTGRLREWFVRGYIRSYHPPRGSGTRLKFSEDDLYFAALYKKLIDFGMNREAAKKLTEKLSISSVTQKEAFVVFVTGEKKQEPVALEIIGMIGIQKFLMENCGRWIHYHIIDLQKIRNIIDNGVEYITETKA